MKRMKLVILFQICLLLLVSYEVSANSYDTYILKFKGNDNIQIITEEEKEFLLSNDIMGYDVCNERAEIEYIEPNYEVELFSEETTLDKEWNVNAVKASSAWNYGCYGNEVKIAVIDSGVYNHPYLKDSLLEGYNTIDETTNTEDNIGHGTFVSSIISGIKSTEYTCGVAQKAKIIPIKCFDPNYSTKVDIIAEAIDYAVNVCDCDIINMSFGLRGNSTYLKEKIDMALQKGVILIAAVGNEGNSAIRYPAAYDGVVGVGAIDSNCERCTFSQYNSSVDVVAPGDELFGFSIDGFTENRGTSFSAPHVSAAAAIAKCINPHINSDIFNSLIQQTSIDLGEIGYDVSYGYGMLDVGSLSMTLINDYEIFMSPINYENSKATITLYNNSEKNISAKSIFAYYDDNKFMNCAISDVKLNFGEKVNISNEAHTPYKIKCFLWNDLKNLITLTASREYILTDKEYDNE